MLAGPAVRRTSRREKASAVVLALLVVSVECLLLFAFIRGSQAKDELAETSHFLTTLANVQREVLRLQVVVVHASDGGDDFDLVGADDALGTQRAILESQIQTLRGGIGTSDAAASTYARIEIESRKVFSEIDALGADPSRADLLVLEKSVAGLERTVKRAYDESEFASFRDTSDTLASVATTNLVMLGVAVVVAVLGGVLAFILRRRVRAEFADAYFRLEAEVRRRTEAQEMLRHQAYHDGLSGLPNRVAFGEQLAAALASDPHGAAVLFVDLDDFKAINDALGHAAGDDVLRIVGARLAGVLRHGDLAARLGGDEFAILMIGSPEIGHVTAVADRIHDALREPIHLEGRTLLVQASVGIAMGDSGNLDANELMRNADIAMYLAKGQGKDRSEVYQPAMHADLVRRLALRADLEAAVEGDGLVLHYQPIIDLATDRVTAVEALVRWAHPERGLIAPADFIPLAEATGLIVPLGRWVLHEACRQVAAWRSALEQDIQVSINLSPVQLRHPGLVQDVRNAIERSGLAPGDVILEVTESGMVEHGLATEMLVALRALGIRIAIDDFGTGYSSLGQIGHLPVDVIKIDRTFVQALGIEPKETALTATIVRLASGLNLETVAEGVEDAAQLERVRALGCEAAQGFLLSRPMDAANAGAYLESHAIDPPRHEHRSSRRAQVEVI